MDHDQRLKTLLKEFFAEFLGLFFPAWVDRFDCTRIDWLDKEVFIEPPQGDRRFLDLVAKLPTKQPPGKATGDAETWIALVHVEVEAADSVAPLRPRMFCYYQTLRLRHELPVLPIGLYLKVGLEGIGWDVHEERFWDRTIVRYEYAYIGLPALDGLQYLEGENLLGVALAALMRIPPAEKTRFRVEAAQRVAASSETGQRRWLLYECIDAYTPLSDKEREEVERLLLSPKYAEARIMAQTTFEKGMEKGMEKGQRSVLERLLTRKFGPLGPVAKERLATWPSERLDAVEAALLTANSLCELGLED
jgi:hypothetical protein